MIVWGICLLEIILNKRETIIRIKQAVIQQSQQLYIMSIRCSPINCIQYDGRYTERFICFNSQKVMWWIRDFYIGIFQRAFGTGTTVKQQQCFSLIWISTAAVLYLWAKFFTG